MGLKLSSSGKTFAALIAIFFAVGAVVFLVADSFNLQAIDQKKLASHADTTKRTAGAVAHTGSEAIVSKALIAAKFRSANEYDTTLRHRFVTSTDYYALFRELDAKVDGESIFMRAILLERCKGLGKTYSGESNAAMTKRMNDSFTGKFIDQRKAINTERMQTSLQVVCRNFPDAISIHDIEHAF